MKILHVITHYYPHVYGAENFAQHLAEWQSASKTQVYVVTGKWNAEWESKEVFQGVSIFRVPVLKIRYIQTILVTIPFIWKAWSLIKKENIQVIHTHGFPGMIVGAVVKLIVESGWWIEKKFKVKSLKLKVDKEKLQYIATIQGGDIGDYDEVYGPFKTQAKSIIGWSLRKADIVHCVSTYLREEVIKMGVDPNKIVVVPNGVDIDKFKVDEKSNQQYNNAALQQKSNKGLKLISTSRLEKKNNLVQLIELVSRLRKNGWDIELDIYGKGSLEQDLRFKIQDLGLEDVVRMKGYVENKRLPEILPNYDFFIRLSTQEGFGISFIEAMACGVIPIGTPVGGITDIIQNGVNGYLLEIQNSKFKMQNLMEIKIEEKNLVSQIEVILKDAKTWEQIRRQARKTVEEKFSWESVLSNVESSLYM